MSDGARRRGPAAPLAPQVLGALVRRYGRLRRVRGRRPGGAARRGRCSGRREGVPDNPRGWLITVASRRLTDQLRSERARRRREETVAALAPPETVGAGAGDDARAAERRDDTLTAAVPVLPPGAVAAPSQLALTLRAVGGLTTAEIARAFLVPEATMAQRISRAKQRIKAAGSRVRAAAGSRSARERLRRRAARPLPDLQRGLHRHRRARPAARRSDRRGDPARPRACTGCCPTTARSPGLLALMLLTDARRAGPHRRRTARSCRSPSRTARRWDRGVDRRGRRRWSPTALARAPLGPYQLQAAIAAVHDEAADAEDTDWPQILALYGAARAHARRTRWSRSTAPSPSAMVHGPRGRAGAARRARRRRADRRPPPPATPSAPTCWRWPASRAAPRDALPRGRAAHDEPARAALPAGAGGPAGGGRRRRLTYAGLHARPCHSDPGDRRRARVRGRRLRGAAAGQRPGRRRRRRRSRRRHTRRQGRRVGRGVAVGVPPGPRRTRASRARASSRSWRPTTASCDTRCASTARRARSARPRCGPASGRRSPCACRPGPTSGTARSPTTSGGACPAASAWPSRRGAPARHERSSVSRRSRAHPAARGARPRR